MAFHVNPKTGDPSRCRAREGNCPFAGEDEHYPTREEAALFWEEKHASLAVAEPLKKTLVLSDIDGTLVKSSLVLTNALHLHDSGRADLGDLPERWRADMKNEALVRELAETYRAALSGRTVGFVKAQDTIRRLLASDENFYSTLKRLVDYKAQGHEVVLISGSPDFLVGPFAKHFGFKYYGSKYHRDRNGVFTGEITLMAGANAKEAVIEGLGVEKYDRVIGLGDTVSDSPLLAASHESVIVDPTDETLEVLKAKNIRIDEIVRK